jgi:hypothetical protein
MCQISGQLFYGCSNLREARIHEGVRFIKEYVFGECTSMTHITLPNSLTDIARMAFYNCSSLKEITIPNGVRRIGTGAFEGCSNLRLMVLPDHLFLNDQPPTFRGINPKIKIYKQTRLDHALQVANSLNLIVSYFDFQKCLISEIVISKTPSLELFTELCQFITPFDFISIVETLKHSEANIPTKIEHLQSKLIEMGPLINVLDFLSIINTTRIFPVSNSSPLASATKLGLFYQTNSSPSAIAHGVAAEETAPLASTPTFDS